MPLNVSRGVVSITEQPEGGGWLVTWPDGVAVVKPTAVEASDAVADFARRLVEDGGYDAAYTRIEWAPLTSVGRAVVKVITGGK